MKIFVCEFVSGGGLYRETLPASLASEGDVMLNSLMADLLEIPDIELVTTRDVRMPPLQLPVAIKKIHAEVDVWDCWRQEIEQADAVWPVAPESGGMLERLSAMVHDSGKVLLGSDPATVAIASRKSVTSSVLLREGINAVPTWLPEHFRFGGDGAWVAKPDDGAGCEDTRRFDDTDAMRRWLEERGRMSTHVIQPCLAGTPASLSLLALNGESWLLSCNRQTVHLDRGIYSYRGSVVNGMQSYWDAFDRLGRRIVQAMPGLAGYLGVDVMVNDDDITVLEINPRLTTSYAGVRQATGLNPARLVLDLIYNKRLEFPGAMTRNVVKISLAEQEYA